MLARIQNLMGNAGVEYRLQTQPIFIFQLERAQQQRAVAFVA